MSDIQRFAGGNALNPRDTRRTSRQLSRYAAETEVSIAHTDSEADKTIARLEAYSAALGQAIGRDVRLAETVKQIELLYPEMSGELAFYKAQHRLAMHGFLDDLERRLHRC